MNSRRVDVIVNRIAKKNKHSFLSSFFKRFILEKFKKINKGIIEVIDGDEKFYFGNKNTNDKVKVKILHPEFYVLLGTRGLLGVSEAYAAGFWKSDNLVLLIRIVFQNKELMHQLDSGWAKFIQPINSIIHFTSSSVLLILIS